MSDAKRTYVVETYGCQMNVHDSERIAGLLEADGYVPAATPETADVVVVNTCSVRERAEEKLFTRLGEIRAAAEETGHRPLVAVAGCVAQQEGAEILKRSRLVDVVVGTQAVKQLPSLVARAAEGTRAPLIDLHPHEDVSFPFGLTRRDDPVRAYVTIIEGCNEFCSFCVVPYTRGHERMRPVAEILAEVRHAAATGRREVQLLGQIVNHYQAPDRADVDFAALLELVQRRRRAGAHPLRQPASAPLHAAHDRRDPRPAEGLQAPPHARAVRLDADPEGDAPALFARGVPRPGRLDPRDDSRRRAVHGHDRGVPRRDRRALRGDAVADARGAVPQHVSRSSTRRGRARWRGSAMSTTSPSRRRAGASSRCSSCSGRSRARSWRKWWGRRSTY